MHILALASLFPPDVGGAPQTVEQFIDHLCRAGHDVEVVAFGSPRSDTERLERQRSHDIATAYRVHRVPCAVMDGRGILAMTRSVLGLSITSRLRRQRFDAIFCGMAYPCASISGLVRLLLRTPFVVYAHGEDVSVVRRGSARSSRFKSAALRWGLRRARTVFANSSATMAKLQSIGHPTSLAEILPPSIDPDRFERRDPHTLDALRQRLGLGSGAVLLTLARLTSPRKGHDIVVQALTGLVARHPDLQYVVVGLGDPEPLRQLATRCGVDDHLTIVPSVSVEELPALMQLADVYVMPSRWDPTVMEEEGFGIVYLEAAAAGTPSVAGDGGGAVDAVLDGVTGLTVPAESPEAVGAALDRLLSDPELAARMGDAGRRRVATEFSNEAVLPRLDAAMEACRPGSTADGQ